MGMFRRPIEEVRQQGGLAAGPDGLTEDIFMACASYEPRTTSVAQSLQSGYRCEVGLIYHNREFVTGRSGERTHKHLGELRDLLESHCERVNMVEGSWLDEVEQFRSIRSALGQTKLDLDKDVTSITLDTTTFNREALIVTLALLRDTFPRATIRLTYVSPARYGDWLSRGFHEVRSIIGFPGVQRASLHATLVILSGFEPDRVSKLIEEHEPRTVLVGIGNPPTASIFLDRNVREQKLILSRPEVEHFEFATDDVDSCSAELEEKLVPYLAKSNVILAPMSTKLSTIAAFLVAEKYNQLQLTSCLPGEYNRDDYSDGEKDLFIYELPPVQAAAND